MKCISSGGKWFIAYMVEQYMLHTSALHCNHYTFVGKQSFKGDGACNSTYSQPTEFATCKIDLRQFNASSVTEPRMCTWRSKCGHCHI